MNNCSMILAEKLQKYEYYYQEKTDKYEYLTGEEILPSDQDKLMEDELLSSH